MSRGPQLRLDVSRLSVPGTNAAMSALIQQFLPQVSFSAVVDRAARTVMLWSADKRMYYVHTTSASAQSSTTDASTSANAVGAVFDTSVGSALQILKNLKNYAVYDMSARLTGSGNVNGHPVTMLQYSLREQRRGGALQSLSGNIDLADDQQDLPIRITSAMQGRNFSGSFRVDFSQLSASAPDASEFVVPAGFTQTNDPSQIFGISGSAIPH